MELQKRFEFGLFVGVPLVFAEDVVQEFGGRPGDGGEEVHHAEDEGGAGCADGKAVADAEGLGDYPGVYELVRGWRKEEWITYSLVKKG